MTADPRDLRIRELESALKPFVEAAKAAERIMPPMAAAGFCYAEQCSAFVWTATRHVSVANFRDAATVLEQQHG